MLEQRRQICLKNIKSSPKKSLPAQVGRAEHWVPQQAPCIYNEKRRCLQCLQWKEKMFTFAGCSRQSFLRLPQSVPPDWCEIITTIVSLDKWSLTFNNALSIEIKERFLLKVKGWIFLTFQPKMNFSICSEVKLQIFYQKNNVYASVMQNIGYLCKKHE